MNISKARVLITGGSSGIGLATARLLSEAGASVAICGRDESRLRKAAEAIGATPIQADVGREEDVVSLIEGVVESLGGYDTLINNAGIGSFGPLVELEASEFERIWRVNVLGAMLVARESARHFVRQNTGNIVNVASTSALRGFSNGTSYVSSKFALSGMTQCWRAELRSHNVRVMQINPSEVITEFSERAGYGKKEGNPTKLQAEDIGGAIVNMLRMHDRGFITESTVWATNPED